MNLGADQHRSAGSGRGKILLDDLFLENRHLYLDLFIHIDDLLFYDLDCLLNLNYLFSFNLDYLFNFYRHFDFLYHFFYHLNLYYLFYNNRDLLFLNLFYEHWLYNLCFDF